MMLPEDFLITVAVFGGLAVICKIFAEAIIRSKLINKGIVDEKVKHLFTKDAQLQRLSSLKWGLVLVAIGLALFFGRMFDEYITGESVFGLMLIFAGVAFLIYYGVARKYLNRSGDSG